MTGISTLGQTVDQIKRIQLTQNTLATLQRQISTGRKASLFKDLGNDVLVSTRARESVSKLQNYVQNIDTAGRRIKLMDSALDEISNQAQNMIEGINTELQEGEADFNLLNQLASNAFDLIGDLLNEKDGDRFLFAGSDSRTQPFNDSGSMDSYMVIKINDWVNNTITSDQLITQYRDNTNLTDTIVGYPPALSSGNGRGISARVNDKSELDYTVLANEPGIRDIMSALGMIKNLTTELDEINLDPGDPPTTVTAPGATQQEQNSNFYQVLNNLTVMIKDGIDSVRQERLELSTVGVQMNNIQEDHIRQIKIQEDVVGDVENIDITEVAFKLNSIANQMEATFRVTAMIRDLSLVNFI